MKTEDYKVIEMMDNLYRSGEGMVSITEEVFLYNLAKECNNGVIVEIGSTYGRSTIALALGSKAGHGTKVYSIDPHNSAMLTKDSSVNDGTDGVGTPDIKYYTGQGTGESLGMFKDSVRKFEVENIIVPIVNYSELAYIDGLKDGKGNGKLWDLDIGLLFIDGDHRLNYVKKDIELWAKHVVSGGVILFHDYPYPGVRGAIDELIMNNPRYISFRGCGVDPIVNVTVK